MNVKEASESRAAAIDALAASSPAVSMRAGADLSHDHHFRTDELLANLKNRTISSGFITLTAQGVQFALTLASTMILARLLTPRDFGLIAMVWTVMGFLRVFKEAGLSTATVQREGITHAQVSNLFWINVALSGAISLLLAAAAPVVAWFYREPRLVGITIALSVTFCPGWFGGPAYGASEPADAFQNDRAHPGRFCFGRSLGGHWHGLAELWLLVPGRAERDDKHGGALDDLVGMHGGVLNLLHGAAARGF